MDKLVDEARGVILDSWDKQDFNHLALTFFDLKSFHSSSLEIHDGIEGSIANFYFDLASVTKVLGMGSLYAKTPELFDDDMKLLLEHRGGLPRWAILGTKGWIDTVEQYAITPSETEYSDLSMLRLMRMVEEKSSTPLKDLCSFYWDSELVFWKDLPEGAQCPDTGFRKGKVVNGEVNDDNCFKLDRYCSHAGLFSTPTGLTNSLFNLQREVDLLAQMEAHFSKGFDHRYIRGWDTVSDPMDTLAGIRAPRNTFGHLGFTGTSVWIDAKSGKGWSLLTNATRKYWYNRVEINDLRKKIGQILWNSL